MRNSQNFAQEIRQQEFTKRECTLLLGKPDGQGGIKPVHGSTVQRFCREKPEKITRLFHPGQSIPYAFRIVSDELIAKIIHNRSYEFVINERQSHKLKNTGGVFEAEIIDDDIPEHSKIFSEPTSQTRTQTEEENTFKEYVKSNPEEDLRNDMASSLISVDGIRTQYIEKMDKLEAKIGDLNRENGELSEAKKYLQAGLENKEHELNELKKYNQEQSLQLTTTIEKQSENIEKQKHKIQSEKNKNIISAILFIASFIILSIFFWYKLQSLQLYIATNQKDLHLKEKEVKITQLNLDEERNEHKQTVSDLRASIDNWRLNSESHAKYIKRLDEILKLEQKKNKDLKNELEILRTQLDPQPIESQPSLQNNNSR